MVLVLAGGGLGPGYETGIVGDLVSRADKVYVETYTLAGSGWLLSWARRLAGERVVEAPRSLLEEGSRGVIEEARHSLVVVLVPGDPLVATTHRSLIVEAERLGVPWRVVPGVSGVCAAKTRSLLDFYKFGRTVTVPGPWRGVKAYSVIEYILANACAGLHTLLLLDVEPGGRGQLDPGEAARVILSLARDLGVEGFLAGAPVIVVERAGLPGERASMYRLGEVPVEGWRTPSSMALPGPLNPVEREALEAAYGWDPGPGLEPGEACRLLARVEDSQGDG